MASILLNPCQACTSFAAPKKHKFRHHGRASGSRTRLECKYVNRTSSFNYRSSAGIPLHELPWASFDQYIEDKGRVIRSIFPEKSTSQQLNEEEWIVKMTPIQALFLKCEPVIHITAKCISEADDYPPEIPGHITKFLKVQIVNFNINARGALYLEREGRHNWMKNQLDISVNLAFPPLLSWVPEYVLHNITQSVLKNYVEDINNGFAVRLLADYNSFKRNKPKYLV